MILTLLLACARSEPDAAPFAGVLLALDRDGNGVVSREEYPARSPGGAAPEAVDRDGDGAISAAEVRDEVYAVDPASFDSMAWAHSGRGTGGQKAARPPAGPLAEALRFLADLQVARAPGSTPPTDDEIAAASLAGMQSPAGAAVLARFDAAGLEVPAELRAAAAEPPPTAELELNPGIRDDRQRLVSDGPGGAGARREAPKAPHRPRGSKRRGPGGGERGEGPGGPGGPQPDGAPPPGGPGGPGGPQPDGAPPPGGPGGGPTEHAPAE